VTLTICNTAHRRSPAQIDRTQGQAALLVRIRILAVCCGDASKILLRIFKIVLATVLTLAGASSRNLPSKPRFFSESQCLYSAVRCMDPPSTLILTSSNLTRQACHTCRGLSQDDPPGKPRFFSEFHPPCLLVNKIEIPAPFKLPFIGGPDVWEIYIASYNIPSAPGKSRSIVISARNFLQFMAPGDKWWQLVPRWYEHITSNKVYDGDMLVSTQTKIPFDAFSVLVSRRTSLRLFCPRLLSGTIRWLLNNLSTSR
jgi:hypothetical protein